MGNLIPDSEMVCADCVPAEQEIESGTAML